MEELFDEIGRALNVEERKIHSMIMLGFNYSEIARELKIKGIDLLPKWKKIKEKLIRRVVPQIK